MTQPTTVTELALLMNTEMYTETYPKYMLLIDVPDSEKNMETLLLQKFIKLKEGVYYTYDTHLITVVWKYVKKCFGPYKVFILTETMSSVPSNWLTSQNVEKL